MEFAQGHTAEPGLKLKSSDAQSQGLLFLNVYPLTQTEKAMAPHSSVLAWRIPGTGNLVGCRLWGRTESDTTEVT